MLFIASNFPLRMAEMSFVVLPSNRSRINCPTSTIIKTDEKIEGNLWLRNDDLGVVYPGYAHRLDEEHVEIFVVLYNATMRTEIELLLTEDQPDIQPDSFIVPPIEIKRLDDNIVQVKRNGALFTNLHQKDAIRPYFMPLIGPFGQPVTREFPLKKITNGSDDHIHHRSFWSAWGDVNNANHWDENISAVPQEVVEVPIARGGYCLGHIQMKVKWMDKDGENPILDEIRDVFIHNSIGNDTLIDLRLKFASNYGPVTFGDTKEGGFCSVRVADSYRGSHGGRIENSNGLIGESECWGKKATWCDYSGTVAGQTVGITIMDFPENVGYPTYWHVRDYGLMAANPFAISEFKNNKKLNGSYTLPANQIMDQRYRLLVHAGMAKDARVADCYSDFVAPPELKYLG
jgi:hypothetical protein